MAKPNYSFEKRQRELAKKKKKEEKLKDKTDRKHVGEGEPELNDMEAAPAETNSDQGQTPA
jgi:hypothetical protein